MLRLLYAHRPTSGALCLCPPSSTVCNLPGAAQRPDLLAPPTSIFASGTMKTKRKLLHGAALPGSPVRNSPPP